MKQIRKYFGGAVRPCGAGHADDLYRAGKLVEVEYLTVEDPTAILTGDNVKVFFLEHGAHVPVREMVKQQC